MRSAWVDFKTIKQAVPLETVLQHYGIKLKRVGKELRGKCPIHQGEGAESFHANLDKKVFHCFSCGAKGNVLDFVAAMEKCTVRDAALKLQDWFSLPGGSGERSPHGSTDSASVINLPELARDDAVGETDQENKPLGFTLSGIDHRHSYLQQRGIESETAEYFGVGYFSGKGSMHGRIVIPIENERGELVAYAGRSIDRSEPKYKLPAGFHKSAVLYNLPRAVEESSGLVVLVEGYFDCFKVTQAGYPCVALMGCSMSERQEQLLASHFKQVVIMLDGDDAGRKAAGEIALRLAHRFWVRIAEVPDGQQPDQMSAEELQAVLKK